MGSRIFTDYQLGELLREGKSVKEISDLLKVSTTAVYKRVKALKANISRQVVVRQAGEVLQREIDLATQMKKILNESDFLMSKLSSYIRRLTGDDELARQEAKEHLAAAGDDLLAGRSLIDLMVKIQGEHRQQLTLLIAGMERIIEFQRVEAFMQEVLKVIGRVSPAERDRIIQGIRDLGAVFDGVPGAGRLI